MKKTISTTILIMACILFEGCITIKASQTELEMITTDRAELEAILQERQRARKEVSGSHSQQENHKTQRRKEP